MRRQNAALRLSLSLRALILVVLLSDLLQLLSLGLRLSTSDLHIDIMIYLLQLFPLEPLISVYNNTCKTFVD